MVQGEVKGSQMCFVGSGGRKGNTFVAKLNLAEMSAFVESAIPWEKKNKQKGALVENLPPFLISL